MILVIEADILEPLEHPAGSGPQKAMRIIKLRDDMLHDQTLKTIFVFILLQDIGNMTDPRQTAILCDKVSLSRGTLRVRAQKTGVEAVWKTPRAGVKIPHTNADARD